MPRRWNVPTSVVADPAMDSRIAVALVHHPVLNRFGEQSTTAITSIDIHDFVRSCAFYDAGPVYIVHPADGMHALVADMTRYWQEGAGGTRNPGRTESLTALRMVRSLEDVLADADYTLWYTSAQPPVDAWVVDASELRSMPGNHLLVFGTGSGLDVDSLPSPNGWLSPVEGIGKVRHLSVRAALAIYLDRLYR